MIATDEEIVIIASDDHQHEVIVTDETQIENEVETEDIKFLATESDSLSPLNLVTTSTDSVHMEQDFVHEDIDFSSKEIVVDIESLTLKMKYQDTLLCQDFLSTPGTMASLNHSILVKTNF